MKIKNKAHIQQENTNLYISLWVIAAPIGRTILLIFNFCLSAAYLLILYLNGKAEHGGGGMLVFSVIMLLLVGLMWKYWLWNACGREELLVTDTVLVSYYDYKLFKTKPKYIQLTDWCVSFERLKTVDDIDFGYLVFLNQEAYSHITYAGYQSTVLLSAQEFEKIKIAVEQYHLNNLFAEDLIDLN